mmetsp:Transcript_66411/g.158921  ORF Transcript_66411/g.158921 Transcript_66411/m.158921 type:complete len:126 (+) Transcript_66411:386-763(+)
MELYRTLSSDLACSSCRIMNMMTSAAEMPTCGGGFMDKLEWNMWKGSPLSKSMCQALLMASQAGSEDGVVFKGFRTLQGGKRCADPRQVLPRDRDGQDAGTAQQTHRPISFMHSFLCAAPAVFHT